MKKPKRFYVVGFTGFTNQRFNITGDNGVTIHPLNHRPAMKKLNRLSRDERLYRLVEVKK